MSAPQSPRFCRRCKRPVAWSKITETSGISRRRCAFCGRQTVRIKGARKAKTMPKGLYNHRLLVKEADGLWRQIIHNKAANGCCAMCGKHKPLQAAHNISRRVMATRHDVDNGLPLCSADHRLIDSDAEEKRALFLRYLGPERYERLQVRKKLRGKTDLHLVIFALRQYISRGA